MSRAPAKGGFLEPKPLIDFRKALEKTDDIHAILDIIEREAKQLKEIPVRPSTACSG
jgi:hypothetical protein